MVGYKKQHLKMLCCILPWSDEGDGGDGDVCVLLPRQPSGCKYWL